MFPLWTSTWPCTGPCTGPCTVPCILLTVIIYDGNPGDIRISQSCISWWLLQDDIEVHVGFILVVIDDSNCNSLLVLRRFKDLGNSKMFQSILSSRMLLFALYHYMDLSISPMQPWPMIKNIGHRNISSIVAVK